MWEWGGIYTCQGVCHPSRILPHTTLLLGTEQILCGNSSRVGKCLGHSFTHQGHGKMPNRAAEPPVFALRDVVSWESTDSNRTSAFLSWNIWVREQDCLGLENRLRISIKTSAREAAQVAHENTRSVVKFRGMEGFIY